MRARGPAEGDADDAATPEPAVPRRAALAEVERLGVLYGLINHLAPLARLCAIVAFLGSHDAYRQLLGVVMASIVAGILRHALFKLGGAIATKAADQPSPGRKGQSRARAFPSGNPY